jgi:transposase
MFNIEQDKARLRIVILGGSGQIGEILARHFHADGHLVTVLARSIYSAPWRVLPWDGKTLAETRGQEAVKKSTEGLSNTIAQSTPSVAQRDQRQLLIHRWGLVRLRARAKNELQHLAMNKGVQKKARLWSKTGQKLLRELPLQYWAGQRRENLLRLMTIFDEQIAVLDLAVEKAAQESEMARLLMTQPGVGPITSLAFVLTMGDVTRFQRGKQVASYLGLIPCEYTTGGRQRLGAISKQGNRFLRMLLVEAAHSVIRCDPGFRKQYLHHYHKKPKNVTKVAVARKLAIRLYWMLRTNTAYPEIVRMKSSSRVPLVRPAIAG